VNAAKDRVEKLADGLSIAGRFPKIFGCSEDLLNTIFEFL
jgi:hypothetical protein